MDDSARAFAALSLELFYIGVIMSSDRTQNIKLFGKGFNGDVVTGSPVGKNNELTPLYPLFKETQRHEIFTNYKERESYYKEEKKARNIQQRATSTAEKLIEFVKAMEEDTEANFFLEILQKSNGEGQFIKITLRKLIVNPLLPALMNILKVVGTTEEMNMNRIIRPVERTQFGPFNIAIYLEHIFVFIHPPDSMNTVTALIMHISEMNVFTGTEWKEKKAMKEKELRQYFPEKEFSDELFIELDTRSPCPLIPVSQNAITIKDADMNLVLLSDLETYIKRRTDGEPCTNLARNVMQPTFLAQQTRNFKYQDSYLELNFNRGVVKIGEIKILANVELLQYMMAWSKEAALQDISSMKIQGHYESHLRTIIKKAMVTPRPTKTKVNRGNMDIEFYGLNLALLDDVFNTNLPMMSFSLLPISAYQNQSSDYNGFKDLSLTIEGNVFNYNSHDWEPIFENFTVVLNSYSKEINLQNQNFLEVSFGDRNPAINLSAELGIMVSSILTRLRPSANNSSKDQFKIVSAIKQIIDDRLTPQYVSEYDKKTVMSPDNFAKFVAMKESKTSNTGYDSMAGQSFRMDTSGRFDDFLDKSSLKPRNILNFKFNDSNANQDYKSGSSRNSQTSTLKINPLLSRFDDNKTSDFLSKGEIEKIKDGEENSSNLYNKVFLREIPFRIENRTGRDMIFRLKFDDMSKDMYIKNLEEKDLAYPFSYEKYMKKEKEKNKQNPDQMQNLNQKSKEPRSEGVYYKIYEIDQIDDQYETYCMLEDRDLHSIRRQKLPYSKPIRKNTFMNNEREIIRNLRHIIMDTSPLIMKKNILLKSPVQIINNCEHHIQIHFFRGEMLVYTLQTLKSTLLPVPVDMLDCKITFDVANISQKTGKESDIFLADILDKIEDPEEPIECNERFAFNLLTTKMSDETLIIHISPPMVFRNLFLVDMQVHVLRESMGREYSDSYDVMFNDTIYPNYVPLKSYDLRFRVQVGMFESEVISIDTSKYRAKEHEDGFWMYFEQKKKFTLNYNIFYKNGTFFLSIYCEHLVFDEIFKRLVFKQTGERFDDILISTRNLQHSPAKARDNKSSLFDSSLLTSNYILDNAMDSEYNKSTIYMLPFAKENFRVSDQKDQYELAIVRSAPSSSNSTYTVKSISSKTNMIEAYDVIAINTVFTLSKHQ